MRLHVPFVDDIDIVAFGEWAWKLGDGILDSLYVSEVDNPAPKFKSDSVDVPGTNGSVYMDEATGRTYFQDKTVKVVLAGKGEVITWANVETLRSALQGRLIDFTFDDISVYDFQFQTGRVTVDCDYKLCTVTLTISEVSPFLYANHYQRFEILKRTNYEIGNNADNWHFGGTSYVPAQPSASSDTHVNSTYQTFAYAFDAPNRDPFNRTKGVGAAVGAKMLVGIKTLVGGDVWFVDADGNKSKTFATTCPTTLSGSTSELRMFFTCDGSYYEWWTVNGVRKFLPTVRCSYALSNYVPVDGSGNIINLSGDNGTVTHDFPSNVEIRPACAGTPGVIIADGVACDFDGGSDFYLVPRLAVPGIDAAKDGLNSKSVFTWIPSDSSSVESSNTCLFQFVERSVF